MGPASPDAAGDAACARLHDLADVSVRELQRRPEPEQDSRSQRHADAEEEHGQVDANHCLGGERRPGQQALNERQTAVRVKTPSRAQSPREVESQ